MRNRRGRSWAGVALLFVVPLLGVCLATILGCSVQRERQPMVRSQAPLVPREADKTPPPSKGASETPNLSRFTNSSKEPGKSRLDELGPQTNLESRKPSDVQDTRFPERTPGGLTSTYGKLLNTDRVPFEKGLTPLTPPSGTGLSRGDKARSLLSQIDAELTPPSWQSPTKPIESTVYSGTLKGAGALTAEKEAAKALLSGYASERRVTLGLLDVLREKRPDVWNEGSAGLSITGGTIAANGSLTVGAGTPLTVTGTRGVRYLGLGENLKGKSEDSLTLNGSGVTSGNLTIAGTLTPGPEEPRVPRLVLPVMPGEELWVIAQPTSTERPAVAREDGPGTGALVVKLPGQEREVPVPLKHTDVKAEISGYISTVEVTQQFHNPFGVKIEAVYVFPLPNNAAVNEFLMTVGERKIRGIIRERQEAEQIYKEARRQGYVASLLTQERPNVFTQRVANIEPGKQIDINIKYFSTLAYADGWYEFVFPMVVGPRFNPPGSSDGVGAVGRGARGISGQSTEVQYLRPGERSGHDISLAVNIDAGVPIEALTCTSHIVTTSQAAPERATAQLCRLDAIPNKDFVLRFKVAGNRVRSALMTHRDARGGFFTLMLYPPETLAALKRAPMEMVFVVDRSGSMSGKPIEQARAALERGLRQLQPDDTFQIIDFSVSASQFGPVPVAATADNVRRGLAYAERLNAGGGTMMMYGLRAALGFPHDPGRLRFVCFLTDGYIGNEAEIIGETHRLLGDSRIFSFGVGNSVNRHLLDEMARAGRGVAAYLALNDDAGAVMDLFFDRVSHPAMADLAIDWGGMRVTDLYPRRLPDLFVGRPVVITGRFNGNGNGAVRVRGKVAGEVQELALDLPTDDLAARHPGIPCVWARTRIADLADRMTHEGNANLPTEIRQVALEYGLMSAYTAFVAVDSLSNTGADPAVTKPVPVPMPDGVSFDATVKE